MRKKALRGFTLIEIMVALAVLGVIVVVCGRIFEQSNISWKTGTRRAETAMVGRGLASFIAQDLSKAVARSAAELTITPSTLTFKILDEGGVAEGTAASPLVNVNYNLTSLTRNGVELAPANMVKRVVPTRGPDDDTGLPGYVDVVVEVEDEGTTLEFKSRAWLANRDRYRYDL